MTIIQYSSHSFHLCLIFVLCFRESYAFGIEFRSSPEVFQLSRRRRREKYRLWYESCQCFELGVRERERERAISDGKCHMVD